MKPTQIMTTPMFLINKLYKTITPLACGIMLSTACHLQASADNSATSSTAVYYANQAGAIAGAAESCGQSIDVMKTRSLEVINVLAKNNVQDQAAAQAAFDTAYQAAKNNSSLPTCSQVIRDFNSLPLLQADYQTTVLAPLRASNIAASTGAMPAVVAPAPMTPNATGALPVTAAPAPQAAANPIFPALSSPTQNYVAPINLGASANLDNTQTTEAAKLQLAQQLTQMAQTLVSNGQPPAAPPAAFNNQRQLGQ